jgi:DNA-binding NarL/FixJ family response regulator
MIPKRILIADDHEVVRQGLKAILASQQGWHVCGEAVNGREAVDKSKRLKPDVVILDISMPELNGLEATRQIREVCPQTQVLILTVNESEELVKQVFAAGARGYLLKSDAGRELTAAVEALSQGRPFFTPRVAEIVLQGYVKADPGMMNGPFPSAGEHLTSREREITQLLAEGKTNKEVATVLNISVKTAETHRTNIMRKLKLHSVGELVRYAIRNNMINP